MRSKIRDGLSDWHYQFARVLLIKLLCYRSKKTGCANQTLQSLLAKSLGLLEPQIAQVVELLVVRRTQSGTSLHKSRNGTSVELAINFGRLEDYASGGEFEEYAAYADDPVIGSRWVQNVDDAILLTLSHELAHYLVTQRWVRAQIKPHGPEFQQVYRLIREAAANPILDEFARSELERSRDQYEIRLLRKIQALKKLSEDKTSNENEAERALVQLTSLLKKHGLDESPEPNQPIRFIERTVPVLSQSNFKPLLHCCSSVERFCGVKAVIHAQPFRIEDQRRVRRVQYITYLGAASDVEMAVYLSELLYQSVNSALAAYQRSDLYRTEKRRGIHSKTLIASFVTAFVDRIARRMREARDSLEEAWVAAQCSENALVVQKEIQLFELFRKRYPRLGRAASRASHSSLVKSAFDAGRNAANQVNLNRPLSQSKPLALGHSGSRKG